MFEIWEIVLIDNREYIILSLIDDNMKKYIYLESVNNPKEILVGKMTGPDSFDTLNNINEIEYALAKFNNIN